MVQPIEKVKTHELTSKKAFDTEQKLDRLFADLSWMCEDHVINSKWERFTTRLNKFRLAQQEITLDLFDDVRELTQPFVIKGNWKVFCKQLKKVASNYGIEYPQ